MSDVVVFAGTTEGCEICSFLAKNKVSEKEFGLEPTLDRLLK